MGEAPNTLEESTDGMIELLKLATRKKHGGKVVRFTGEVQIY